MVGLNPLSTMGPSKYAKPSRKKLGSPAARIAAGHQERQPQKVFQGASKGGFKGLLMGYAWESSWELSTMMYIMVNHE